MAVVYLLGLSSQKGEAVLPSNFPTDIMKDQLPEFHSRAIRTIASALSVQHPHNVLHTVQAEVLFSYYLISNRRFVEAHSHVSSAVALMLSNGFHKIGGGDSPDAVNSRSASGAFFDNVEYGERIRATWTVIILDKCWAVSLGSQASATADISVTTSWPWDMSAYEQVLDVLIPHRTAIS